MARTARRALIALPLALFAGQALEVPVAVAGTASRSAAAAEQPARASRLSDGVYRFLPATDEAVSPSLAFMNHESVAQAPAIADGETIGAPRPVFAAGEGLREASVSFAPGTRFYGLGGAPGRLVRNGLTVDCNTPSQPGSLPWLLALQPDGSCVGLLVDTNAPCRVDLSKADDGRATVTSASAFALVVVEGNGPEQVLERLSGEIGTTVFPPLWALGFSQTISAADQQRVLETAKNIRTAGLSVDTLRLSDSALPSGRILALDRGRFADPAAVGAQLEALHLRSVLSTGVCVGDAPGYFLHDQLVNSNFAVKDGKGSAAKVAGAGGAFVVPDFGRPDMRKWWSGMHKDIFSQGVDALSLLNTPGLGTLSNDAATHAGSGLEGQEFGESTWGRMGGAWNLLASGASFQAFLASKPALRPLIFTAMPAVGSQRYAVPSVAAADGDQPAIARLLNLSLSGQPLVGLDTSAAKSAWAEAGVWTLLPMVAGDAAGAAASDSAGVKLLLDRRSRLTPYIYSCVANAHETGAPVLRPVWFIDPRNAALREEEGAFLLGPDLLVVPGGQAPASLAGLLDEGGAADGAGNSARWRRVNLVGEGGVTGAARIYVRPGAIVPVGPIEGYTQMEHEGPLTLIVNLDENNQASGDLYEDLGDSTDYIAGKYLRTTYAATLTGKQCQVQIAAKDGDYLRGRRDLYVALLRGGFAHMAKGLDGMSLTFDISRRAPEEMGDKGSVPGKDAVVRPAH